MNPDQDAWNAIADLREAFHETGKIDWNHLKQVAYSCFDAHANDSDPGAGQDRFFSYLTAVWQPMMDRWLYHPAQWFWKYTVDFAKEWEGANQSKSVHKGTPYYFWGGTAIFAGELKKGFLLLHASYEEDLRKHGTPSPHVVTPALSFIILDTSNTQQALLDLLQPAKADLEKLLADYRSRSGSRLTLEDFQVRFLKQPAIRELVFIFAYSLFEKMNLAAATQTIRGGRVFGSQMVHNCLFDLCQVIEESIRNKSGDPKPFRAQANFLYSVNGWSTAADPLKNVNAQASSDLDSCLKGLLDGKLGAPSCPLENDLWITYALRNSGAHSLTSKQVLYDRFDELYAAVMRTLFGVVDKLY